MDDIIKYPESQMLIRFPDCDPFNHLNNSRYIDYFINAREDHLMKYYQFNIYKTAAEKGLSWVVGQHQIAFLRPALLMETVIIQSSLLKFGEKEVLVEMQMWDKNKQQLKSLLWTIFVHYNLKSQKSEIHSDEFKNRFKVLEVSPLRESSFEERVKTFKQ
jgi:YbgC/YbaW family acyl-CoA thioester hydrolase